MIKVTGLNHVTINVRNLECSLEFYCNLGVRLVHQGKRDAYLEWGNAWLCLQERPDFDHISKNHIGVDHIAFTVDAEDFDNAVNAISVPIEKGPIDRGIGRSVYFRDPDGNLLEFHTSNLKERMSVWK